MGDLTFTNEPKLLVPGQEPTRTIIYGAPGAGKTRLGLTWPRPFVIDTNRGLEGGAVEGRDDIMVVQPQGHRDLTASYHFVKRNTEDYDTIFFDDATTLVRLLLNEQVDDGGDPTANYEPGVTPELRNYLAEQKQMERILTDFRRLGKHIVVAAGVRQPSDAAGNITGKRTLDTQPGIVGVFRDWASVIGELVVLRLNAAGEPASAENGGVSTRVFMCDPSSEKRECKTRWSALEPHVIDPTFPKFWDLMKQGEVNT